MRSRTGISHSRHSTNQRPRACIALRIRVNKLDHLPQTFSPLTIFSPKPEGLREIKRLWCPPAEPMTPPRSIYGSRIVAKPCKSDLLYDGTAGERVLGAYPPTIVA
ncbi:hypothetical protein IG631_23201 [Alternaria alternata]|nr:hypothetical protein IG631_23201 [Alternaria alternata]